ncbi:MAG: hypothetical protein AAFZ07_00930 [Actinomycetota bacterium]
MATRHTMTVDADNGDELLLTCDHGCGRRVVISRSGRFTVIDRGDVEVLHSGSSGPLRVSGASSI